MQKNMKVETSGHRARLKGGYFPVAPIDNGVDIRAEMMQVLEQVGLEVNTRSPRSCSRSTRDWYCFWRFN